MSLPDPSTTGRGAPASPIDTPHIECVKAALRNGTVDPRERTVELRDEVHRLQAWISRLVPDVSCEDPCPVVCAGPCVGRPFSEAWP